MRSGVVTTCRGSIEVPSVTVTKAMCLCFLICLTHPRTLADGGSIAEGIGLLRIFLIVLGRRRKEVAEDLRGAEANERKFITMSVFCAPGYAEKPISSLEVSKHSIDQNRVVHCVIP